MHRLVKLRKEENIFGRGIDVSDVARKALDQGHPTDRFGEYLFGRLIIATIFGLKCDENLEFSLAQIFLT